MNSISYPMLKCGFEKLSEELTELKRKRLDISARIEEARQEDDLAENTAYATVREEQGLNEARLQIVESRISQATIIDPKTLTLKNVQFGHTVRVVNNDTDEEKMYQIVSDEEVSVPDGKISTKSPLARCLIGATKGDVVSFEAPGGEQEYTVVKIFRR